MGLNMIVEYINWKISNVSLKAMTKKFEFLFSCEWGKWADVEKKNLIVKVLTLSSGFTFDQSTLFNNIDHT